MAALEHSISDQSLKLPLPHSTPETRVQALLDVFHTNDQIYITPAWIDAASRIKRRVTTLGGSSGALQKYLVEHIRTSTRLAKATVQSIINPWFMYDDSRFTQVIPGWQGHSLPWACLSIEEERARNKILDSLLPALRGLTDQQHSPEPQRLGQMAEQVKAVLLLPQELPWSMILLPCDDTTTIWHNTYWLRT